MELVEVKYWLLQLHEPIFNGLGKTFGLLIRLTQEIWNTSTCVVLESGFCVFNGIAELQRRGAYSRVAIKKHQYFPKYTPDDTIVSHLGSKTVGNVDELQGTFDNSPFRVYCKKNPDYTTIIVRT